MGEMPPVVVVGMDRLNPPGPQQCEKTPELCTNLRFYVSTSVAKRTTVNAGDT